MKRLAALLLLLVLLMAACGPSEPAPVATPKPAEAVEPSAASASPEPTEDPSLPVIAPSAPYADLYASLPVAATVSETLPVPPVESAEAIGWRGGDLGAIEVLAEFSGDPRGFALFYPQGLAVVMNDEQGRSCVYAGNAEEDFFAEPLYVAEGEYPTIDTVTGTKDCVYFVAYNASAWQLMQLELGQGSAPEIVDQGGGRPPRLMSGEGDLAYLVEMMGGGYEMRVWQRQWDGDIVTRQLGVISLPGTLQEPERAFLLNSVGITHTEARGDDFVAVAENLEGVQTAIGFAERPYQAMIGANGVAWLDGRGAFCAYDPESGGAVRYGEGVTFYAPVDGFGDDGAYLFGGSGGVYALGHGEEGLTVLPIAEGGGWRYLAAGASRGDALYGYFLRAQEARCQIVRIRLAGIEEE